MDVGLNNRSMFEDEDLKDVVFLVDTSWERTPSVYGRSGLVNMLKNSVTRKYQTFREKTSLILI